MSDSADADGPGRIIWLASYPKSGNTWMRVALGHLLGVANPEGDINQQVSCDGIASSREDFDDVVGVNAAELDFDQIDVLRPRVYECLSREAERTVFLKVHDACLDTPASEPMFPLNATRGVVHIVRNPLDVVASLAHHSSTSLNRAIQSLCSDRNTYCASPNVLHIQLRQRLLDWSAHTASWLDSPLPRLTVRYEDMLAHPFATFATVARFCGLEHPAQAIEQAVEGSRFERLKNLEAQTRFRETPQGNTHFFREGRAGGWREALTAEQVQQIIAAHGPMMQRLGYATGLADE